MIQTEFTARSSEVRTDEGGGQREGKERRGHCSLVKVEEDEVKMQGHDIKGHRGDKGRKRRVTKLIELRVDSGRTGHRTDQPGFEERGPTVDQTPLPADVILDEGKREVDKDRVEKQREHHRGKYESLRLL